MVRTFKVGYNQGPITNRSRLTSLQECAGSAAAQCFPAATFEYEDGAGDHYEPNLNFNLQTTPFITSTGDMGLLTGDFNGDGRQDLLRWSDTPSSNFVYLSVGDGSFVTVPSGSNPGQFNIKTDNLGHSNGCYITYVVDLNGDGMSDLLRYSNPKDITGSNCSTYGTNLAFISKGDGSFTKVSLPASLPLERLISTANYPCNGNPLDPSCQEDGPRVVWTRELTSTSSMSTVTAASTSSRSALAPGVAFTQNPPTSSPCTGCTRVFLGDGVGGFSELIGTNVANETLYSDPKKWGYFKSLEKISDLNGDGLPDLQWVGNPFIKFTGEQESFGPRTATVTLPSGQYAKLRQPHRLQWRPAVRDSPPSPGRPRPQQALRHKFAKSEPECFAVQPHGDRQGAHVDTLRAYGWHRL